MSYLSSGYIWQKDYYLIVNQLNGDYPLLYSDEQIINVDQGIETYELKFKIGVYYNEKLYLFRATYEQPILIDNCMEYIKHINYNEHLKELFRGKSISRSMLGIS